MLPCACAPQVAEVFTGSPGKYVDLANTISGFKGILEGKYDDLPEMAFYMVGDIKEVQDKAARLVAEAASRKEETSGTKKVSLGCTDKAPQTLCQSFTRYCRHVVLTGGSFCLALHAGLQNRRAHETCMQRRVRMSLRGPFHAVLTCGGGGTSSHCMLHTSQHG